VKMRVLLAHWHILTGCISDKHRDNLKLARETREKPYPPLTAKTTS
jgi:hypothetical protein